MRRTAVLLAVVAAVAVLPDAAHAKGVSGVEVCGASGCVALPAPVARSGAFMEGGLPAEPPSGPAAWYRIRYTISPAPGEDIEPFKFSNIYVPSADRVRERAEGGGPAWFEPAAEFVAALRPYLERVSAFPASRLRATAEPARPEATPRPAPPPAAHAGGEDGAARTWILVAASLCALLVVGVIARGRRGSLAT